MDSAEAKALPAIGRIYRIALEGEPKVTTPVDSRAEMPCPNGVSSLRKGRLLVAEFFTGNIFEFRRDAMTVVAQGLRGADGIEEDRDGNIYVSSWTQGKVWRIPHPHPHRPQSGLRPEGQRVEGEAVRPPPELIAEGFQSAADFFLDQKGHTLVLPDMKAGTVTFMSLPPTGAHTLSLVTQHGR